MSVLLRTKSGLLAGTLAAVAALTVSVVAARPAAAQAGASIYAAGGDVTAMYLGRSADYFSVLSLVSPTPVSALFDSSSAAGTTVNVGSFAAGEELIFKIDVYSDASKTSQIGTWLTGPAPRNADNFPHASVTFLADNTMMANVAYEDMPSGGDQDYNDFRFKVSGVTGTPAIPEPGTIALLASTGLPLVGVVARRRRSRRA